MCLATRVWMPFVIGAVALSIAGSSMGLLFAAVRDELSRQASPVADRVISAIRKYFAWLADRISPIRVVAIGAAFGVAANIAYATSEHVLGLFVGQMLMSALWAAIAGLGVTVAQQLYPYGVGLASSVFMSSIMLSGGLGGVIGGIGTALVGVPHVFFVSAVLGAFGTAGLVVLAHRHRASSLVFG